VVGAAAPPVRADAPSCFILRTHAGIRVVSQRSFPRLIRSIANLASSVVQQLSLYVERPNVATVFVRQSARVCSSLRTSALMSSACCTEGARLLFERLAGLSDASPTRATTTSLPHPPSLAKAMRPRLCRFRLQ